MLITNKFICDKINKILVKGVVLLTTMVVFTNQSEAFKMADVMQELCDYEKKRLDNVEKNIELMKTLGKILL